MKLSVNELDKDLQKALKAHAEQVPIAAVVAATWTAKDIQGHHEDMLPRIFDRPTRNTLKGLYTKPATKAAPRAYVGLKDYNVKGNAVSQYLRPSIEGGPRVPKRFERLLQAKGHMRKDEYAVPGSGEPVNSFGNISQGKILKALANLRSLNDFHQNSVRGKVYFAGSPYKGAPRGIWVRHGRRIRPFMIFVTKRPAYRKQYDFEGLSEASLRQVYEANILKALDKFID